MNNKRILVLDWDDTINDTFSELHTQVGAMPGPKVPSNLYLTPANTNGRLTAVLDEASFMGKWLPRPGMQRLTTALITAAERGVGIVVCTHRGYHAAAPAKSEPAIAQVGFPIHRIHWLDPAEHSDKVVFLDTEYGDRYRLVDDRPRYDDGAPLPRHILLMDQPWNRHIPVHSPENRVSGLNALAHWVTKQYC